MGAVHLLIMLTQKCESKLSLFFLIIMKRPGRHHLIGKNKKNILHLTSYISHLTSYIFPLSKRGPLWGI